MKSGASISKGSRGFLILMVLAGLCVVAEGVGIYFSHRTMAKTERRLQNLQREWRTMGQVSPAPTEKNATAIAEEVDREEVEISRLRTALMGGKVAEQIREAEIPGTRTDAFFDLAGYVEALRGLAKEQGVALSADERFGFSEYATAGPTEALIPTVFEQRQALDYLLRTLLAAKPERLLHVWRSPPIQEEGEKSNSRSLGDDEFILPPKLSLQKKAFLTTQAFRIRFIGETSTLRAWVNRLSHFELPVAVRLIEVAPVKASTRRVQTTRSSASSLVLTADEPVADPLVRREPSEFTVTLEVLALAPLENQEGEP